MICISHFAPIFLPETMKRLPKLLRKKQKITNKNAAS